MVQGVFIQELTLPIEGEGRFIKIFNNRGDVAAFERIDPAWGRRYEVEEITLRQGKWLPENNRPKSMMYVCSVCSGLAYFPFTGDREGEKSCKYAYCPRCGVKIKKEDES